MALKKRSDGRYKATYTHKGKKYYFYGATRDEANAKREAYIDTLKKAPNMDGSITVSEWLDEYLIDAKTRVSRATYSSYESLVRIHLKPGLGDYPLIGLQPHMIRDFLYRKLEDGSSTRSVEYMYVILKAALTLAVNDGLLYRNPAAGVRKPKVQKTPAAVLTLEQLKKLLNAIDDDLEYFRLIYITASTGLRREEVLALRIKDIDTRRRTLSVQQTLHYDSRQTYITKTTKTASSRRTIALDDITYGYVQEQMQAVEKRKNTTFGYKDLGLLFPSKDGNPLFPAHISKRLKEYAAKAKLPANFTFHGLRHTHATLLLESGANYKSIQIRLGHSSFKTTMDTYSHVTANMEDDLLKKIPNLK